MGWLVLRQPQNDPPPVAKQTPDPNLLHLDIWCHRMKSPAGARLSCQAALVNRQPLDIWKQSYQSILPSDLRQFTGKATLKKLPVGTCLAK